MKKLKLFSLAAVAMLMAACSSDDKVVENNGAEISDGQPRYALITIGNAHDITRAEGDQQTGQQPGGDAIYEVGYSAENTLKSVRFYFFDDAAGTKPNTSAVVSSFGSQTEGNNYVDVTSFGTSSENMPNVEKKYTAVLTFHAETATGFPKYVVALANMNSLSDSPKAAISGPGVTLAKLEAVVDNCGNEESSENGFVMFSTTYLDGSNIKIADQMNTFVSEDAAKANPTDIYLERSLAKVRIHTEKDADITLGGGDKLYDTGGTYGSDDKKVYVKFGNWMVTSETTTSYLHKHIDDDWGTNPPFNDWNYAPFRRCYWAINPNFNFTPSDNNVNYLNGLSFYPYNDSKAVGFHDASTPNNSNVQYTQENAHEASKGDGRYTKVLVKGTLCDAEGNALEIGICPTGTFIGKDNLKTELLSNLKKTDALNYYKKKAWAELDASQQGEYENEADYNSKPAKYCIQMSESDVKFVTVSQAGAAVTGHDYNVYGKGNDGYTLNQENRHEVVLQLSGSDTWYNETSPGIFSGALTNSDINAALALSTVCKLYNSGQTYYWFNIKHLGAAGTEPEFGIVRNHIYDCQITGVSGFGTPVFDPEERIIPEKPVDRDTYIATRINILSWRVVNNPGIVLGN